MSHGSLNFLLRCCNLNCRKPSSENNYKMWIQYADILIFFEGILNRVKGIQNYEKRVEYMTQFLPYQKKMEEIFYKQM